MYLTGHRHVVHPAVATNYTTSVSFQWPEPDIAVPDDYDGDGQLTRRLPPASGEWFVRRSTTGYATSVTFNGKCPATSGAGAIAYAITVSSEPSPTIRRPTWMRRSGGPDHYAPRPAPGSTCGRARITPGRVVSVGAR